MAISIIANPPLINSVHNRNKWLIDSNNKLNTGFRYLMSIIDADTGATIFQTQPIPPRPVDGYGEFDVSAVLKSVMDSKINVTTVLTTASYNSSTFRLRYRIVFGESYVQNWPYTDTDFISGSETICIQTPGVTPHSFNIGDAIDIIPNDPSIRPGFIGLYNVIDTTTYGVVVNANWMSTPLNPGVITFADKRKTQFTNLLTGPGMILYNCVIPTFDWPTYNFNIKQLSTTTKELFTNFQDGFYINSQQDMFWPLEYNASVTLNYVRNDGVAFTKIIPNPSNVKQIRYVNVTLKSGYSTGVGSLFSSDIRYYDFYVSLTSNPATALSKRYRINVNNLCKSSDIEILFEDRMGGYNSFAFEGLHSKNANVTKEQYNQAIQMSSDRFTSLYDPVNIQGQTIITVDLDEEYTLTTRAIKNKNQYQYFEELISSPNTYIKLNGNYQRCEITTTSITSVSNKKSGLRTRTVNVKLANKNGINY